MRIEIRPGGGIDHVAVSAAVDRAVERSVEGAAQLIANDMRTSIARGPKTGRIYTTYFRRNRTTGAIFPFGQRVPHQASAPGEPPATDTGRLVGAIATEARGSTAVIEVRAIYARWLEYGTRHMAARPFMIPAVERNRQRVRDLIRAAVASAATQWQQKTPDAAQAQAQQTFGGRLTGIFRAATDWISSLWTRRR